MPEGRPASSPLPGFVRLAVWCIVVVSAPLLLLRGDGKPSEQEAAAEPASRTAQRDRTGLARLDVQQAIDDLKQANPDYVGIGNSMMFSRLGKTTAAMNGLTGKKFHYILKNGSSSAIWYLTLKNVVAASGVRPKLVFFFVRDDELTAPLTESSSNDSPYLVSLRGPSEPELDRLMGRAGDHVTMKGTLDQWFHFPAWDDRLPRGLADLAMDIGGAGASKKAQRLVLSERFSLEHLRKDLASDKAGAEDGPKVESFEAGLTNAPLTSMLKIANEHGLKLLFFRVKRRPEIDGKTVDEPKVMQAYAARLKSHIESKGGVFFDETYDPGIQLSDYLDGDHIHPDRIDWYRRYFWQRTAALFP